MHFSEFQPGELREELVRPDFVSGSSGSSACIRLFLLAPVVRA